ncbi:MAG: hypothetical protein HC927_00725, partial [Deltaproteobacteria bacterium]|nr:hypothetical protein [Deltaproteobacteria bacterium]
MSLPVRRVLPPDIDFLGLAARIENAGWARDPTAASGRTSLRPGEPELAAWLRGDARLTYTANPVVGLRVLELGGVPTREQRGMFDSLPGLDAPALARLLESDELGTLLLACFAAAELELIELLPQIEILRTHAERRVAAAAERSHRRLGAAILQRGLKSLAARRKASPDRDPLFESLPDPRMRRQLLRRMAIEFEPGDPRADAMLRSGLDDRDWEVRASAMLLAARLRRDRPCPRTTGRRPGRHPCLGRDLGEPLGELRRPAVLTQ